MVVARHLAADREEPRAHETPIFVFRNSPVHHQEDFLQGVVDIGEADAEPPERSPDEIGVRCKDLLDLMRRRGHLVLLVSTLWDRIEHISI